MTVMSTMVIVVIVKALHPLRLAVLPNLKVNQFKRGVQLIVGDMVFFRAHENRHHGAFMAMLAVLRTCLLNMRMAAALNRSKREYALVGQVDGRCLGKSLAHFKKRRGQTVYLGESMTFLAHTVPAIEHGGTLVLEKCVEPLAQVGHCLVHFAELGNHWRKPWPAPQGKHLPLSIEIVAQNRKKGRDSAKKLNRSKYSRCSIAFQDCISW